ncbi:hypothetical protein LPJ61_001787 [Coemansia biformis]|uniref:Uncharacterized protein n=1 Tax=Coemansia biformis TaxID=1286918 RepID=A0A9W7Y9F1_9FUNG|nr:hypothetical protein LPJ61_001787 [Coemansia biformis]
MMKTGAKMQKLSLQVKGCFDGLKRRRRSGFSSDGSSQRSSAEMEIIHVSMEESRRATRPPEAVANMAPMNYWVTSDDESSIYSCGSPSRDLSYVDILDEAEPESPSEFMPLRSAPRPAPKVKAFKPVPGPGGVHRSSPRAEAPKPVPKAGAPRAVPESAAPKPVPKIGAPKPVPKIGAPRTASKAEAPRPEASRAESSSRVKMAVAPRTAKERRFSREEWQEKADEAVFGSFRGLKQLKGARSIESDDDDDGSTATEHRVPRIAKQASGISVRAGQSPNVLCTTALSDLLFTTNAQVDTDLHDMMEDYVNGRGLSNLTDDFEAVVEHAYAGFLKAAQPILEITGETTRQPAEHRNAAPSLRRYPSSRYEGSMESLLSELVDCYTTQTEESRRVTGAGWQYSCERASTRKSAAAEDQMTMLGIDIVKYTKDQLRRYAATSIAKYISSQVLISTGIENDLADRLDSSAQTLRTALQQKSTIESLHANKEDMGNNCDLAAMRKKIIRLRNAVRQLKDDARDASNIRRIFEMALLEIQLL